MLFLQKETFFSINRYYLLSALTIGLMVPLLGGFLPANPTSTEIHQVMTFVSEVEISPIIESTTPSFNWFNLLYFIYVAGVLVVLSRFVYGLSQIYTIFKNASKTKKTNYTLVESSHDHLPFSFFHFIFISKTLLLNKDVERILKHEELHVNQWHSIDIVFTELLQAFFWFNPILIFYKNALKQSHEYLADAYVTREYKRSSYGQLLLRQSTSGLEIALANHFFHSHLKKRITMLYKEKSKRPAMVKYLAAIPVLVVLLILFASNTSGDDTHAEKNCIEIKINNNGEIIYNTAQVEFIQLASQLKTRSEKCILLNIQNKAHNAAILPILNLAEKNNMEVNIAEEFEASTLAEYTNDSTGEDKATSNHLDQQGDPIFKVVEEMPRFPGCEDMSGTSADKENCAKQKMLEFIYKNVQYPKIARDQNIQGMTIIQFIVEKDGSINEAKLIRDIGGNCGTESLRVVNSFPTWIPGKQRGKAVRVQYTLPVKYKLQDETPVEKTRLEMPNIIALGSSDENNKSKNLVNTNPTAQDRELFKVVEDMPRFPGCEESTISKEDKTQCSRQKMLEFIYTNLKYPREARKLGIDGIAVIQMVVEKDGSITSIEIIRNPGGGTGEEARRVIELMPTWIPGKQRGQNVAVQYTLPIKYKLEGGDNVAEEKKDEIATDVDQKPLYANAGTEEESNTNLINFVFENVTYPKDAIQNNIEGIAVIKFIINTQGNIENIRLVKSPGWGIDKSVLSMMDKMKEMDSPWEPAMKENDKVNFEYVLPVKFKLQDSQINEARSRKLEVQQLQINPNPSNGIFTLAFDLKDKTPADVIFYSMNGQVVKNLKQVNLPFTKSIDLSQFNGQIVFLNILQKDKVYTDKIVIQ